MKYRIQDIQHEENDADVPEEKDRVGLQNCMCRICFVAYCIVFGDLTPNFLLLQQAVNDSQFAKCDGEPFSAFLASNLLKFDCSLDL